MKSNVPAFAAAAAAAVIGALMTLDWSQIFTQQTAGVVLIILGGIGATIKAYTMTPPTGAVAVAAATSPTTATATAAAPAAAAPAVAVAAAPAAKKE